MCKNHIKTNDLNELLKRKKFMQSPANSLILRF